MPHANTREDVQALARFLTEMEAGTADVGAPAAAADQVTFT